MNISGYAHFNGITLCNDTKMVSVYSDKKHIIKTIKFKNIGIGIGILNRIIFIRQIQRIILNPILWQTCLMFLVLQIVIVLMGIPSYSHAMIYATPLLVIIIYAIRTCTNLFKYHAVVS